ncbi:MAG: type II toxin-antitoxin system RelE/ParE family toxin [Chloroflexi bacterium]|nr:type II toxin-antitoxin system RelE/ParE family toxin [Chloroflexota bacterium]
MGSEFTFYDYIDDTGSNTIHSWLNSIDIRAKEKLNKRLLYLEGTSHGNWKRPLVDTLTDDCAGLFEVRARLQGQQYRILGSHSIGQKTPTLLYAFIKKGDRVPADACQEAFRREAEISSSINKHRVVHNYE